MTTANHSTNQQPHGLGNLGQIIEGQEQFTNTREKAEEILDGLAGANLTATVRTLNGLTRGCYRVTVKSDAEFNETQVRLYESNAYHPIATGYVDRGHTKQSHFEAAEEVRELVRAYLCR